MELYRRYRPRTFDHVIGNEETIQSLRNMLKRKTLPHALLFHGPSGCGKTTLARILKEKLQCNELDYHEVNSSSFRGIDTVREIIRTINLAPVGDIRIYLMDEVHKWTNDAQNAALKMLEDPPSHTYFFLCTTEPEKLLKTVRTRCCEMPVRYLTYNELEKLALSVAKRAKIELSKEIVDELVSSAQGSARILLVMLDKIQHLNEAEQREAIVQRMTEENEAIDLCRALFKGARWKVIANLLRNLKGDPESVRWSVLGYAKTVLLSGKNDARAYIIIDCFRNNFYDSKEAGLAAACYEVIHGEG